MPHAHVLAEEQHVLREVCAHIDRIPQPTPGFNPTGIGDCFLCSSAAIIWHFALLAGVAGPPLADLYHRAWATPEIGAARGSNHWANHRFWHRWQDLLGWRALAFEIEVDPPCAPPEVALSPFGPSPHRVDVVARRVRTYLEAGYLVHVEVQLERQRDRWRRGLPPVGADHVVVIDGYRLRRVDQLVCAGDGRVRWGGRHVHDFHVVDSVRTATEPYWITVDDWVADHGGWNMVFVRPATFVEPPFAPRHACPDHPTPSPPSPPPDDVLD